MREAGHLTAVPSQLLHAVVVARLLVHELCCCCTPCRGSQDGYGTKLLQLRFQGNSLLVDLLEDGERCALTFFGTCTHHPAPVKGKPLVLSCPGAWGSAISVTLLAVLKHYHTATPHSSPCSRATRRLNYLLRQSRRGEVLHQPVEWLGMQWNSWNSALLPKKTNQFIFKSHFPQNYFLRILGSYNQTLSFCKCTRSGHSEMQSASLAALAGRTSAWVMSRPWWLWGKPLLASRLPLHWGLALADVPSKSCADSPRRQCPQQRAGLHPCTLPCLRVSSQSLRHACNVCWFL